MHQNHPTFYIVFWAIRKIDAIPSLINTNLSKAAAALPKSIQDETIYV